MCSECLSYYCPKNCPNYDGTSAFLGKPTGRCELCEAPIYEDQAFYEFGDEIICAECIEELDICELLDLLGFEKTAELLSSLGHEPKRA